MRICLFQPEIPGNFGNIIRTMACFDFTEIDIIMPTGFALNTKEFRRSVMDYGENFQINKFANFNQYKEINPNSRFVLSTTKTKNSYTNFKFKENDILIFGSESKGSSEEVHNSIEKEITIPISKNFRSLNLAISVSIIISEAKRQFSKK